MNVELLLRKHGIQRVKTHPDILSLLAPLDNMPDSSNFEIEQDAVARAVARRRREFFAGRNLARIALQLLGGDSCAIPCNKDRTPLWPSGFKGSISHSEDYVMVALTGSPQILGVGIDIESAKGVDPELRDIISQDERESSVDETVLFSAKEAVFKAVFPICREFLEFNDVAIFLDEPDGKIAARGRSDLDSSRFIDRGTGYSSITRNLVTTVFWICL
jgi:4'-phosphopantetheinyl transferase EntD